MSTPPLAAAAPPLSPDGPPKGALSAIFLIILVDFLGFGLIIPLLPFYVPDWESSPLKVTLIFSIFSICQFVGAPVLGALSDRYGRRPVLIVSQIGSAIGYVILAIAATPAFNFSPEVRLGLVYLSRIIDGFSGGNVSTAQAYISDVTDAKTRSKGMGLIGAAFGIGFCVGPFLGGVLGAVNPTWPAYAAALLAALAALQTWARLPEPKVHRAATEAGHWLHPRTFGTVFRTPIVAQLILISFVSMAAFVMMEATSGIFMADKLGWGHGAGLGRAEEDRIAARNTGWFFAYAGLVIVIVQGGLIRRLTKRGLAAEWAMAIVGPVLVAVGMAFFVLLAYTPMMWVLLMAGGVNALGRSLQGPTLSSLLSKYSDPREQGVVFGMYHGLSSLARVFGPLIAGLAYTAHPSHAGQFVVAGVMVLLVAAWTVMVKAKAPAIEQAKGGAGAFPVVRTESQAQAARTEVE